jgi:PTS system mannose-specific IIA component
MIGIVVVSHGQLARELVSAAEMIVREIPNISAVSMGWHDDPHVAQREIEEAVARVDTGAGVIVLTDMFGGTPTNLSLSLLERDKVEVLTGVNLPMLIKLINLRASGEATLLAMARQAAAQGKESIYLASDLLSAQGEGDAQGDKAKGPE